MDNNPNPHKSFFRSILFFIVAGVVLIIISGLIGYFLAKKQTNVQLINQLTPTSSPSTASTHTLPINGIENWKTHISDKLKLSFAYPSNIYRFEEIPPVELVEDQVKSEGKFFGAELRYCPENNPNIVCFEYPDNQRVLYINMYDNNKNLSIEDWLKKSVYSQFVWNGPGYGCIDNDPRTKTYVGSFLSNRAIINEVTYDKESLNGACKGSGIVANRKTKIVYTKVGQRIYYFEVDYESDFTSIHPEIDQILSTFKFLQ